MQAGQGALNLYKAMSAPGGITGAMSSFDIKIGVGMSVSTQESGATVQQASGGYIMAAGNLGLYATAGDLKLTGANVSAYNVTLSAQRDLVIQSLALTDTSYSKSSSWSAFAGLDANVSYGASGFNVSYGINVSAQDTASQSQSIAVNHAQTTVSGSNWVTLNSGRDTNLYGAEVSGGGITAQVARNLNIVSDQDTETQSASLTSWSFSATIGLYGSPSSISASYAKGDGYGNYASVTTTSGLFAGSSGYAVAVGGTTTLAGAALASSADASKNSLTTGALVTQNLVNSMSWKASYWGFSFSASTAGPGGVQPGLSQKKTGSSTGLAQATIAPGTVTIVNAALQKSLTGKTPDQIVAALNRSATAQNKAADKLPGGLAQTLQNQADRSNALTAASSSTAKFVGDVASTFWSSAAQTAGKLIEESKTRTLSDEEKKTLADAQQQMEFWGEGGVARIVLHGATQGVLAWLGGGYSIESGLYGAGGAMLATGLGTRVANQAQKLLNDAGLDDPGQVTPGPLANLIAEVAIAGFASSFNSTAALTAASVDLNNRQLHPAEIKFLRDPNLIKEFADQMGISDQAQAEKLLARAGASLVDATWKEVYADLPDIQKARDFILSQSVGLSFGNNQDFFRPSDSDFKNFALFGSAALFGSGRSWYLRNVAVDNMTLYSISGNITGTVKGIGWLISDTVTGVATLVAHPSVFVDGVKVLATDPAGVANTAWVTNKDLRDLYLMAGQYDNAKAVTVEFTGTVLLMGDAAVRLPGVVANTASYARGLISAGSRLPEVAETGEGVGNLANAARQPLSTTQLSNELKLADGTLIPKNSIVQEFEKAFRIVTPEGNEVAIAKQISGTVEQGTSGVRWGGGIQGQGMPWEDYLATQLTQGSRLPETSRPSTSMIPPRGSPQARKLSTRRRQRSLPTRSKFIIR